jgi:tight adherence protein B
VTQAVLHWLLPTVAAIAAATAIAALLGIARAASTAFAGHIQRISTMDLAEMFVFVEPQRVARACAYMLLVVPIAAWLTGASFVAVCGSLVLWLLAPRALLATLRARRRRSLIRQLPDACDGLASSLRAGLGLAQSLQLLCTHQPQPIASEFALLTRHNRLGVSIDEALQRFAVRVPEPSFQVLVATLRLGRERGGGLAASLDRVAGTLRTQLALEEKIRALTAQGRLQGVVVSALPMLLVLVLGALAPEAVRALFTTRLGAVLIATIAILQTLGWLWIRRIVNVRV